MFQLNLRFYAAALVLFPVLLLLGVLSVSPGMDSETFFGVSLNLFPTVVTFLPAVFCITLCSTDLDRALSFGARRDDYFRGFLCFTGLNVLLLWGVTELFLRLPGLLGLGEPFGQIGLPSPAFPILLLTVHCAGSAAGSFWQQSQTVGALLWGGLCGFFSLSAPAYEVLNKDGERFLRCTVSGPMILACVFLTVLSLAWIRSDIKTATVR